MELNNACIACYPSIVIKRRPTYDSESRIHVHLIRMPERWLTLTIAIFSVYGLSHEAEL